MSEDFGRRGATGTFTDTVAQKSATQAILIKQDEMIDRANASVSASEATAAKQDEIITRVNAIVAALAVAADVPAINAAMALLADLVPVVNPTLSNMTKVKLVP